MLVSYYLPSPLDVKPYVAHNPKTGDEVELMADDKKPFAAELLQVHYGYRRRVRRA